MSALSTDNDISEAVVISSALESEAGSKYSKQESSFSLGPDLSPRVRPGTSVSVELSARHEPSVSDLVMEDRGHGHSGLPGMVPVLSLQPRVAQARPQLDSCQSLCWQSRPRDQARVTSGHTCTVLLYTPA